jgi:FXSXX-COOH protein
VDHSAGEIVSGLFDLTELGLAELAALDNPILAGTLGQIRDEIEHPEEAAAGFQSSL